MNEVVLDPNDPFDRALIPMVETNRRKRADYARDGNPFSNFEATSGILGLAGFGPQESIMFNIIQKVARIKALRENGRLGQTQNETVEDTYLDLAVYAVLLLAYAQNEKMLPKSPKPVEANPYQGNVVYHPPTTH